MRIDPHVHFRDEEQDYKETIKHGLATAHKQGVDIVFDMPNTVSRITTEADVKKRLALVPQGEEDNYKLYIGATADPTQLAEAVRVVKEYPEVIGIKMFAGKSTGDLAIIDEDKQQLVYDTLAKEGYTGIIAMHCEKEDFMTEDFDPKRPISHAECRPNIAEAKSIIDQVIFAKKADFKGTLHIVHVSTKEGLAEVKKARAEGVKVFCAATPHHLMWTDEKLAGDHGLLYKMNPPLRKQTDVDALWEGLLDGTIDWVETDHAPHTIGEKLYDGHPSGFPSLYLYKELVEVEMPKHGLTAEQIKKLTYTNIAKAFGLE